MPSFKSTFLAVAAAFAVTASAQEFYDIDPDTVPVGTRVRWCDDQVRSCAAICAQTDDRPTLVNNCDSDVLRYGCICGNSEKPNMTEYSLTLPFHMCQEWGNQCVTACGLGANQCASDCRELHPCGAQDPTRVNSTSSSTPEPTASSTTSSSNGIFTGMDGGSDEEDGGDSGSSAASLEANKAVVFTVLFGGLFGIFALAL